LYVLKVGNPEVDIPFRWCPPGWFEMGSNRFDDAKPIHKVTLTKGFWMGETEVTQAQWRAVMTEKPDPSAFKGDDLPVENVSALNADAFAEAIKRATGKPVRLPFEAEWEYACRAGTSTDYHTGDGEEALKKAGWYGENFGGKTHPVRKRAANAWRLFDMHGNVEEWCIDEYRPYQAGDQIDPFIQANNNDRVCRGGSWGSIAARCLAAYRGGNVPGARGSYLGLRVCFRVDLGANEMATRHSTPAGVAARSR
jgi:formylglycine-generating enzyme required for sulfatase activity